MSKFTCIECNTYVYMLNQVDHWLEFSNLNLGCPARFSDALQYLNQSLGPVTYLVGHSATIADFAVWSSLRGMYVFHEVSVLLSLRGMS